MRILSIDAASRLGWCLGLENGIELGGSIDLRPRSKKLDTLERQARIFDHAALWIADMLAKHRPSVVVLEDSGSNLRGEAARVLLGLRAVILLACWRHEIVVDPISSNSWKAWARGHGWLEADKGDEADARQLLAFWRAERARLVSEAA